MCCQLPANLASQQFREFHEFLHTSHAWWLARRVTPTTWLTVHLGRALHPHWRGSPNYLAPLTHRLTRSLSHAARVQPRCPLMVTKVSGTVTRSLTQSPHSFSHSLNHLTHRTHSLAHIRSLSRSSLTRSLKLARLLTQTPHRTELTQLIPSLARSLARPRALQPAHSTMGCTR